MKGRKIKMSGTLEEEPLILIFQIPTKEIFVDKCADYGNEFLIKMCQEVFKIFLYIEPLRNSRQIE